uniref:Integrase catalytic domain-containing protein n=1 Tax=Chenopodium quinoa TaxID=63459 RepID=A0A803N1E1_CHEQI
MLDQVNNVNNIDKANDAQSFIDSKLDVLAREDDNQQLPVYYVSKSLLDEETRVNKYNGQVERRLKLKPLWGPQLSNQALADRILLANNKERCRSLCGEVRQLPMLRRINIQAIRDATSYVMPMALHEIGNGHSRKLLATPRHKVFILALTDFFSKWIEADSFTFRFGIPSEVVCDNGSQFISYKTRQFCEKWNIKLCTSTPRYPQANGQAELSNKTNIQSLKKGLKAAKGKWAEELPSIL